LGELDEVFDGLRSDFGQQFDPDAPDVSDLDDRVGVRAFGDQILPGHGLFDRDGFFADGTSSEHRLRALSGSSSLQGSAFAVLACGCEDAACSRALPGNRICERRHPKARQRSSTAPVR